MHYPITDIQAEFKINRPIRYQITTKRKYFHRRQTNGQTDKLATGQTDGHTDGHTDRQTSRTTTIGRFFVNRKKKLKMILSDMHQRITYMYINF